MKKITLFSIAVTLLTACSTPKASLTDSRLTAQLPKGVGADSLTSTPSDSTAKPLPWHRFFTDATLAALIDTALANNQDLQMAVQQMAIARANVGYQSGALLPSVEATMGVGVDKSPRYTSEGAGNATTDIRPGHPMPDPLMDYALGLQANWEVDLWHKLSNLKGAALEQFLASVEGRAAVQSSLIAQVATAYYNLVALDARLHVMNDYAALTQQSLHTVEIQEEAGVETALGVKKFEAEESKTQAACYTLRQQITEAENNLNLLLGRLPQKIHRDSTALNAPIPLNADHGVPTWVILQRPDVKQAEHLLQAARLSVEAARKAFLPSLTLNANIGLEAFNPAYLVRLPQSIAAGLIGGLTGPIINRKAIEANFQTANAQQLEALYNYEKTLLSAFAEVSTLLSQGQNAERYCQWVTKESTTLKQACNVADQLFRNGRVTYLDVLAAQRDALDAAIDVIDAQYQRCATSVNLYRSMGGWQR